VIGVGGSGGGDGDDASCCFFPATFGGLLRLKIWCGVLVSMSSSCKWSSASPRGERKAEEYKLSSLSSSRRGSGSMLISESALGGMGGVEKAGGEGVEEMGAAGGAEETRAGGAEGPAGPRRRGSICESVG
jgi:hypothetical protein